MLHAGGIMPGKQATAKKLDRSVIAAFCLGVIVTYTCTFAIGKLPPVSVMKLIERMEGHRPDSLCSKPQPPGVGLTPMALAQQSGQANATSDILIVAARHDQVTHPFFARIQKRQHLARLHMSHCQRLCCIPLCNPYTRSCYEPLMILQGTRWRWSFTVQ